ncbi:EsV-1-201 [Ectocarpus siliculosus virus 1]|uniref:EsV-1-201 n=1 Tax=Ectocarpus siliculosus virus 1 (isolate New Zealand/Kaikoura/1988) TaxID=654926 RepID=Q8QN88_ESV1K|nr:EsV-1-201 [Ectocarpus siliculosus virus 1]AAK14615.1 EsV-1-201 [Ectocarpus siliculosus virus 1]
MNMHLPPPSAVSSLSVVPGERLVERRGGVSAALFVPIELYLSTTAESKRKSGEVRRPSRVPVSNARVVT